ncbi:MAG: crossover junction endodeoxyribonuclease RuvC [bacterium]
MVQPTAKIIFGLDPGTATTGYGVLIDDGRQLRHLAHGCILTPAGSEQHHRLQTIAKEFKALLRKYQPDLVAVESLYFFKNVSTAMSVAQARGVLLETAASAGLPVMSFTPLQVKQALTGYGKADKKQIQKMVKIVMGLAELPGPDDAADALAIAITCAHSSKINEQTK